MMSDLPQKNVGKFESKLAHVLPKICPRFFKTMKATRNCLLRALCKASYVPDNKRY